MLKLLFWVLICYLIYRWFIQPVRLASHAMGSRPRRTSRSQAQKASGNKKSSGPAQDKSSVFEGKGEYIDYEEVD